MIINRISEQRLYKLQKKAHHIRIYTINAISLVTLLSHTILNIHFIIKYNAFLNLYSTIQLQSYLFTPTPSNDHTMSFSTSTDNSNNSSFQWPLYHKGPKFVYINFHLHTPILHNSHNRVKTIAL